MVWIARIAYRQACGSFPEVFFFLSRLWAPLHLRDALADCLGVRQAPVDYG